MAQAEAESIRVAQATGHRRLRARHRAAGQLPDTAIATTNLGTYSQQDLHLTYSHIRYH